MSRAMLIAAFVGVALPLTACGNSASAPVGAASSTAPAPAVTTASAAPPETNASLPAACQQHLTTLDQCSARLAAAGHEAGSAAVRLLAERSRTRWSNNPELATTASCTALDQSWTQRAPEMGC